MSERHRLTYRERAAVIVEAIPDGLSTTEAAEVAILARALADPSVWNAPSRELEDLVVHAVLDAHPLTLAPVTAIGPTQAAARRTRTPRRRRVLTSAAAAIAAITVGTGIVSVRRSPNPDFRSNLAATALAPAARASADLYRTDAGFRIELEAEGLPSLSGHAYFEAWLRNPSGTVVPVGTFSSSAGDVTLWSGVSPKEYPTLSVTIETSDDGQLPSRRRVLLGDVRDT
jgi:hypothetical protein